MHIVCFVEEPSVEAALGNLFPILLPAGMTFQFIVFQGKQDLLNNLTARLTGYAIWLPQDWKIIVLVDEDRQDCFWLKAKMDESARSAGLVSKSQSDQGKFQVLNRIAIEELEAWFIGDVEALRHEFPRIPATLGNRQKFRDPDNIVGGTWEALENILQSFGYYPAGYAKLEAARKISSHMQPERNRSHSFQVFYQGLQSL